MFTGLVQSLGNLRLLTEDKLEVLCRASDAERILTDLTIGDSVAVDGACLTVEQILPQGFIVSVSPETIDRTTIGQRDRTSTYANLETSLRVGGKIGGHFVTGHIDGIGRLVSSKATATSWEMRFAAPESLTEQWSNYLSRYLVSKGSIAVNGVSLTIADCDRGGNWFTVAVIPLTYSETNLAQLQLDEWVNLEADILGKYVEKLMISPHSGSRREIITPDFLAANGYQ
ncbi:riboflavin synthase [Chamaesiphon sp.]|uniref:riboflavin synthase n=1 Tax=Chamaesiphon sp. TaxID=2814140 RepID=UPI00359386EB